MGILDKAREWRERRKQARQNRTNSKVEEQLPMEAGPRYSLIKEINKSPYSKKSPSAADSDARKFLNSHIKSSGSGKILPGQLILFNYFEPKTQEDLEYYDASPLTIFFNVVNTTQGKRVLGFNLHYYPPKMRKQIMNTIFDIYKPVYSKYFTKGPKSELSGFDYQYLIGSLERANLEFGVRMYIPQLIAEVKQIPPQMWHIACYTEGWFKKQTWSAVMKYWSQWQKKHKH